MSIRFPIATMIFLLVLLTQQSICLAQSAYLQPARIYEGDIATLVIEYRNNIPSLYAIDTSELEADFDVLDVKARVFRATGTGEVLNRMQWKIQIVPLRSGELNIPSFDIGGSPSPATKLRVDPRSEAMRRAENIRIELKAEPKNPYIGQQTDISIRLLHNVPFAKMQLSEPSAENVAFFRSGDEYRSSRAIDGEIYNLLERNLVAIAQTSGVHGLSAVNFRGQLESTTQNPGQRLINRNSNALQLQARPAPTVYSGAYWLPAKALEMKQAWSGLGGKVAVGDTISRNLSIEVKGMSADALPANLLMIDTGETRVYADQAIRKNRFDGSVLIGSLAQSFEIVVVKPGEIVLPELSLSWWDTNDDVEKLARLPGRILTVTGVQSDPSSGQFSDLSRETKAQTLWLRLLLVLFLISVFAWLLTGNRAGAILLQELHGWWVLKSACLSQNPRLARQALLTWAGNRWPDENIVGLYQISAQFNSGALKNEIDKLDRALFSTAHAIWHGNQLYRILIQENKRSRARSKSKPVDLPSFYPR